MDFKYNLNETLKSRFDHEEGIGEMQDIVNHGIMGGFGGFIYTYEINEFYREFENELEDYFYEMFGDEWLTHCTENCTSMDEVRARMVWSYVEMWCNDTLEAYEEETELVNA